MAHNGSGNRAGTVQPASETALSHPHDEFTEDRSASERPPSYEATTRQDPSSTPSQNLGLINGRYDISCPDLRDWDEYNDYNFHLVLTPDGNVLWGAYDFGMFEGVFRIKRQPSRAGDSRDFEWRGRENGEGDVFAGEECRGSIQFLGGGEIRGMINCYGEARFTGRRIEENGANLPTADKMKKAWKDIANGVHEWDNRLGS